MEENRPPAAQALQDALGILDARAMHDGREEEVFVRVAGDADRIFIDLGDASWRAVRIDSAGWCLVSDPPVRFRRPAGLRPLPEPARGGTIDRLGDFVNIEAAELLLLIAWLAAALRPSGPYPILVLIGEQGSAKSTLARLARRLVDPHASPLRCEPKESRDLMVGAVNGWVLALDNLSTIWAWLSDSLCRLSTGGGFATRTLYSNDEETFLDATRPVILTGITDFVNRGDLIDRALFLHLAVIPEENRRTESAFWRDFEAALPQLFGALLDAVAGGLRLLPEVKPAAVPRMADFAVFGDAVSRALGNPPGTFLDAYRQNRRDANESAVEDNPVAGAVRELASRGRVVRDRRGAAARAASNHRAAGIRAGRVQGQGGWSPGPPPCCPRPRGGCRERSGGWPRRSAWSESWSIFGRRWIRRQQTNHHHQAREPERTGINRPNRPNRPSAVINTCGENDCSSDSWDAGEKPTVRDRPSNRPNGPVEVPASDGQPSEHAPTVREPSETQTPLLLGVPSSSDGSDGSDDVSPTQSMDPDREVFEL